MAAQVQTKVTINGLVVEKVDEFGNLAFYRGVEEDDNVLYLVDRSGNVLRKIEIEADQSAAGIYISDIEFTEA